MTPELAAAAGAFSLLAPSYDQTFGLSPVGLYFRYQVQERLRLRFPRGARVLELGCGSGDDALFLAGQGVRVHAVDVAPGMIEAARAKAAARGLREDVVRFEVRAAEDVGSLGPSVFDGAFSNFGALNCAELPAVGKGLAAVLRPGAPVVLSVVGPRPLPGVVAEALTGRPARSAAVKVAGQRIGARTLSAADVRREMGPAITWDKTFALGVLVPSPAHDAWVARNPVAFGALAALEGLVRRWPLVRGWGDHIVIEGVRK
jgi:ubiquinone/menaquinone biosynthesis C-methylase UbiE